MKNYRNIQSLNNHDKQDGVSGILIDKMQCIPHMYSYIYVFHV